MPFIVKKTEKCIEKKYHSMSLKITKCFYQGINKLFAHIYLSSLSSGVLFAIWRQFEVICHLLCLLGPRNESHIYSARPLEHEMNIDWVLVLKFLTVWRMVPPSYPDL